MKQLFFCAVLVLLLLCSHVTCSRQVLKHAPVAVQQQQQQTQHCSCEGLQDAAQQRLQAATPTVLAKVRMLPTSAEHLLNLVKKDTNGSTAESWVSKVVASTAAAAAQHLDVPPSLLNVNLEASLGSGINVPLGPSSRQQAAVDALAEFYEETAGSRALLVGLNMVSTPASSIVAFPKSSNLLQSALVIASLSGPFNGLANALRMAESMRGRCPQLLTAGSVLTLNPQRSTTSTAAQRRAGAPPSSSTSSDSGSSNSNSDRCAAWLSDYYLPVLTPQASSQAVAANEPMQATVLLPLEVNIKLSVKLALTQLTTDPEVLMGRAREWLQSAALVAVLQQHGLNIGAGSPAHLVTLMSAASASSGGGGGWVGDGRYSKKDAAYQAVGDHHGDGNSVATALPEGSDGSNDAHHKPQAELGMQDGSSSSSGTIAAWGRLQPPPHELNPVVIGGHHAAEGAGLSTPSAHHSTTATAAVGAAGGAHHYPAADDDEIARRTVLGAIVGAVVGSALVGAAFAVMLVRLSGWRKRRLAASGSCGGGCEDGGADGGSNGTRAHRGSSSSRTERRRRSRKRHLKYLPNFAAAHLLPVAAAPALPPSNSQSLGSGSLLTAAAASAGAVDPAGGEHSAPVVAVDQQQQRDQQPVAESLVAQHSAQVEAATSSGVVVVAPGVSNTTATADGTTGHTQQGPPAASTALQETASAAPSGATEALNSAGLPEPSESSPQPQPHSSAPHSRRPHISSSSLGARLMHGLGGLLLRPTASDPLLLSSRPDITQRRGEGSSSSCMLQPSSSVRQARTNTSSSYISGGALWGRGVTSDGVSSGGDGDATAAAVGAVSRQELCSDSVSSAARLDLLQSLQRSASGGSSGAGSSIGGSSSGGAGTAYNPAGSSRSVSPVESMFESSVLSSHQAGSAAAAAAVAASPGCCLRGASALAPERCRSSRDADAAASCVNDAGGVDSSSFNGASSSRPSHTTTMPSPFLNYDFATLENA